MIEKLPPRERQVFDALSKCGKATAVELEALIPGRPSNSAVRVMLSRLEQKGYVTRKRVDRTYVYSSALPGSRIRQSALKQLVNTFFQGSAVSAATALLGMAEEVGPDDVKRLEALIEQARAKEST